MNMDNDPIVRHLGGTIDASSFAPIDNWLVNQVHHVWKTNLKWLDPFVGGLKLNQIQVIITQGNVVNAVAYRKHNLRAIVIPIGLLKELWRIVYECAHTPSVLSVAFTIAKNTKTNCKIFEGEHPADWTLDSHRREYFLHIFCYMIEYVLLHELAHHTRGHLDDHERSGMAVASIDEKKARQKPLSTLNGSGHRDIEFDADAFGLNLSLNALNNQLPIEKSWSVEIALEQLFLLVFSQLLVAQQLDDPENKDQSRSAAEHPSALYRSINYSNLVTKTLFRLVGGAWQEYMDQHDAAWTEASFIAQHLNTQQRHWYDKDIEQDYSADFLIQEEHFFTTSKLISQAHR